MTNAGTKLVTGGVLAVIGLITLKVLSVVVVGVMGIMSFLFTTVLPIAVVGWLVLKLVRHLKRKDAAVYE